MPRCASTTYARNEPTLGPIAFDFNITLVTDSAAAQPPDELGHVLSEVQVFDTVTVDQKVPSVDRVLSADRLKASRLMSDKNDIN